MSNTQSNYSTSPNTMKLPSNSPPLDSNSGSPPAQQPKKLLSTSSPEGIQVASKITPTRLANLLIRKGPLPIRHITSQLALEVPSFNLLSLSKQRRLIMSAMEQTDLTNNVVFEKIGWGQWAVRRVDSDYIVTEGTEGSEDSVKKQINVNDLKSQGNLKLGWSKKQSQQPQGRRESITNNKSNLHNLKLPNENLVNNSNAIESDSEDDYGLSDNMEEDDEDDEEGDDQDEEEDELFTFDQDDLINKFKRSPPIKFANRVPLKISPPPATSTANRRKSSSSNATNSITKIQNTNHRHQIYNRSRLNSLDNLDNYIISSARNSNVSISSPPPPAAAAASVLSGSPINSWSSNYSHHTINANPDAIAAAINAAGRRKSSFNESHIRSTLSSSLPKNQSHLHKPYDNYHSNSTSTVSKQVDNNQSDTDEEDWATIGAESLRKNHMKKENQPSNNKDNDDERTAAIALVDLMSV